MLHKEHVFLIYKHRTSLKTESLWDEHVQAAIASAPYLYHEQTYRIYTVGFLMLNILTQNKNNLNFQ